MTLITDNKWILKKGYLETGMHLKEGCKGNFERECKDFKSIYTFVYSQVSLTMTSKIGRTDDNLTNYKK